MNAVIFSLTLVDYHVLESGWDVKDPDGLFGNEFLRSTMPFYRFRTIYRCIQADVPTLTAHFNRVSQELWTLGRDICWDDDLDLFKGKPGAEGVKYVPKKEAKRGFPHGVWWTSV